MNHVITIAREYGSGGGEIAEKLAEKLGIKSYDEKLLEIAAKESGIYPEFFAGQDEKHTSGFRTSFQLFGSTSDDRREVFGGYFDRPMEDEAFFALFQTMENLADAGPCILVGRCAEFALRKRGNIIRVFIGARHDDRVKRVSETHHLTEEEALERIHRYDKRRASHYRYYTDRRGDETRYFDISLNSSLVGIDGCVDIILRYVELAEKDR